MQEIYHSAKYGGFWFFLTISDLLFDMISIVSKITVAILSHPGIRVYTYVVILSEDFPFEYKTHSIPLSCSGNALLADHAYIYGPYLHFNCRRSFKI
jgi:hypothetical protein